VILHQPPIRKRFLHRRPNGPRTEAGVPDLRKTFQPAWSCRPFASQALFFERNRTNSGARRIFPASKARLRQNINTLVPGFKSAPGCGLRYMNFRAGYDRNALCPPKSVSRPKIWPGKKFGA